MLWYMLINQLEASKNINYKDPEKISFNEKAH